MSNEESKNDATTLKKRLEEINDIIYGKDILVGSEDYFKIRELATEHLRKPNLTTQHK